MGMRKSLKEYIAAFGKWGFLMAAFIVGDIIGIVQSIDRDFLLPQWAWWSILAVILTSGPFLAFHKLRLRYDEIQTELTTLKNKREQMFEMDGFVREGNSLLSTLPPSIEVLEDIDKYDWKLDEWATKVRAFLRPLGYEGYFITNPGLNKEENEDQTEPMKTLAIARNYMKLRLQRLLEIRRLLGD